VPEQLLRLRHDDVRPFAGAIFGVIGRQRPCDEHASFFAEEGRVLIAGGPDPAAHHAGDRGCSATSRRAIRWRHLGSMPRFEALPDDTLALPSHGLPFHGLKVRLDQLRHHHEERLAELLAHLREPRTAFALAHLIFARA